MISAAVAILIIVSGFLIAAFASHAEEHEPRSSSSLKDTCNVPVDRIEDLLNVAAVYEGNGHQTDEKAIRELEAQLDRFPLRKWDQILCQNY